MDIVLLGSSRLLYLCAEKIRVFYGENKEITILDTQPSPTNKKFESVFTVITGKKQELFDQVRAIGTETILLSINNKYIIPSDIIEKPNLTLINLHHALLPNHRGRNAEAWTIFEGDALGGITWHYIDPGIDTGRIIMQGSTKITETMRSIDLLKASEGLALETLDQLLPFEELVDLPTQTQSVEADQVTHSLSQVPGDGFLSPDWSIEKMSCFLRAMDYGASFPMGRPMISIGDKVYEIRRYTFEMADQQTDTKIQTYDEDSKKMIIREKNRQITLKLREPKE